MKRFWIFLLLAALLLTGCAQQDAHPEWDEDWTRFDGLLAVQTPDGFYLREYNDTLSLGGIWYATWACGEERTVTNSEGDEASAYDAQIYLLAAECESEQAAARSIADWISRETESYETEEAAELTAAGQRFQRLCLLSGSAENPYTHGAAAFAARGKIALSAELLCAEGFDCDAQAILEAFLSGIHYGE